jgi:hypothetical protein
MCLLAAALLQELTLAMLEEMDSDVEIPAITEINKNVQLPPAGAAAAAANDEQPPAKKRKPSEGQSAAESADAEMADGAAGQQAAEAEAAEPEVEQYDAGEGRRGQGVVLGGSIRTYPPAAVSQPT